MRILSRFQSTPVFTLSILVAFLMLTLPIFAFGFSSTRPPKDDKKTSTVAAQDTSSAKPGAARGNYTPKDSKLKANKKSVSQPKDPNYSSNCNSTEPNCADKLNPDTAPVESSQLPIFAQRNLNQTEDSWYDGILKTLGLKASQPEFIENFLPGPADECPTGFKSLGGNFNSDPTVNTFKDKVFIFARGTDNALYYLVLEKGKKSNWLSLGGNSISNPGSYFNDSGLFVEVIGKDGQKYYRSTTDGVTFAEWKQGTVNARTTNSKTGIRGSSLSFAKGKGENPPLCYQVVKGEKSSKTKNEKAIGNQNAPKKNAEPQVSALRAPGEEECWWDPWCEPPPPPGDQYSPLGYFDSIDVSGNNGFVSGWSFDPDHSDWSNDVHVYFDGPAGSGTGYGVTTSNLRPDVNAAYGITGNHGFYFQIPAQYLDGQQHVVYVYGIDTGPNPNSALNGNPKYFTINPPPPAAPTWGTVNTISQTQLDAYWNGSPNATGYNVKMDGNQVYSNIPYLSAPFTNLAPGSTHTFEVQAVSQWGVSGWSEPRSATTLPPVMPATPTWGTVNTISQTQLDAYWNAAANATGYNVKMDGNQIHTNIPYTSIPATNLAPGSTHTFEVQGVNQYGVSAWSSPRSGTTQSIPIPSIASVSAQSNPACLNLVINPSAGAVSYNVRITNSGYTANFTQTSFPWCGLTANTYFEFQAQAVTALGTSGWSALVGGTTSSLNPTPTPTPTSSYTLTASPNSVQPSGTVTVSWTAGVSRPTNDWVGIYQVGAANTAYLGYQFIQGGTSGTLTFTMPNQNGIYEFRYFPENGYNLVATSNQVTVANNPTPTPTPSGTPTIKLSKEYIYSGSRQLAVEDYGIAPTNPTPTP